jgi:hypothetical protein
VQEIKQTGFHSGALMDDNSHGSKKKSAVEK